MSAIYDNWERLVAAVLKKEQVRQLCYEVSIDTNSSVGSRTYTSSFSPSVKNVVDSLTIDTSVGSLTYTSSFRPSVRNAVDRIAIDTSVGSLTYTSSLSPSVQNADDRITTVVKRFRGSDIKHGTVAPRDDSYFSYEDEMLVIYEHQSLGGASTVLTGKEHGMYQLKWGRCLRVAIAVAKAIANNHESLHMDDMISGIGLDKMEAASSIVLPTAGYRAPEVMKIGRHPSKASDVYSFGVLLIELLTGGKLVISRPSLVRWAIHEFHEIRTLIVFEFVPVTDRRELIEMWKMFLVAMRCVEENPNMRPEICDVLKMMEGAEMCSS